MNNEEGEIRRRGGGVDLKQVLEKSSTSRGYKVPGVTLQRDLNGVM